MSIYESSLCELKNRVPQVSDEETRRTIEGIIELLEQMTKDLNEVKTRISTRIC